MKLDFFRELKSSFKNAKVEEFINELGDYLKEKACEKNSNKELGVLEQIKSKNKVSMISENKMRKQQDQILQEYANKTIESGAVYFVSSKSEKDNQYIVFKYENNNECTIKLTEKELPSGSGINSVFREENGQYVLDKEETEYIKNEIMQMANKILEEQNTKLAEYRKEGHLYMVEEDTNNRIYLLDLTSKADYTLEEVDFPTELISEATEGTVFKYENGKYNFYSRDGFERIYGE